MRAIACAGLSVCRWLLLIPVCVSFSGISTPRLCPFFSPRRHPPTPPSRRSKNRRRCEISGAPDSSAAFNLETGTRAIGSVRSVSPPPSTSAQCGRGERTRLGAFHSACSAPTCTTVPINIGHGGWGSGHKTPLAQEQHFRGLLTSTASTSTTTRRHNPHPPHASPFSGSSTPA